MLDFEQMLRSALARVGNSDVAVATPYDLPNRVARDLMAEGLFRGLVADNQQFATLTPDCAGWWTDRERGRMSIRRNAPSTILIAGVDRRHRVIASLLLEARLKGVRRVVTTNGLGETVEDLDVLASLDDRMDKPNPGPCVGADTFEAAFRDIYELTGDALRLDPWEFDDGCAMLAIGGLGPGGAERQAAYTAAGVQRSDAYDTHVLCTYVDAPADFFRAFVESAGAKVAQIEREPKEMNLQAVAEAIKILDDRYEALQFGQIYREVVRYAAAIRKLRPVVVHNWMDYCNVMCGTAAALVGVPAVLLSGRSVAPNHFRIFQPYMKPGYTALLKNRHVTFLNNSSAGAKDYEQWLNLRPQAIRVLNNGFEFPRIDRTAARTSIRKEFGIPDDAKLVGSILRFSEEKRPKLAIDMAREIHAFDPAVRFLFCGSGVLLDEVRGYVASLKLQDVVLLPGLEPRNWEVLTAMDCFVLTSRMEGLPNVLIEAQASGLPVVCTGVGGMAETFAEGDTGISVRNATDKSLAEAVLSILSNPLRLAAMSSKADSHVRQVFGIDRMISETIDAYARTIREPHKQAALKATA